VPPVVLQTEHGSIRRSVSRSGDGRLRSRIDFRLRMHRVPPSRYDAFARFARAVDRAFEEELGFAPRQRHGL